MELMFVLMGVILTMQVLQLVAQLLQLRLAKAPTATTATTPGMTFCEPPPGTSDAAGKVWTSKTGSVVHMHLKCSHISKTSNLRVQEYTFCKDCAWPLELARAQAYPQHHMD